jgi:hypothetical protein
MPEIRDPRQAKGLHSGFCSRIVLGPLAGFVNGDRAHIENGLARSPTVDKRQPVRV